jgi:hypothetical protein
MRVHSLVKTGSAPTRRAIYRYFRDTGNVGVDICLLSLADTLATYGPKLDLALWSRELSICQNLFEAWWKKPGESIRPPQLLDGNEIMTELDLKPGPQLGHLLINLREAQATGEVSTREEALDFVRKSLSNNFGRQVDL